MKAGKTVVEETIDILHPVADDMFSTLDSSLKIVSLLQAGHIPVRVQLKVQNVFWQSEQFKPAVRGVNFHGKLTIGLQHQNKVRIQIPPIWFIKSQRSFDNIYKNLCKIIEKYVRSTKDDKLVKNWIDRTERGDFFKVDELDTLHKSTGTYCHWVLPGARTIRVQDSFRKNLILNRLCNDLGILGGIKWLPLEKFTQDDVLAVSDGIAIDKCQIDTKKYIIKVEETCHSIAEQERIKDLLKQSRKKHS